MPRAPRDCEIKVDDRMTVEPDTGRHSLTTTNVGLRCHQFLFYIHRDPRALLELLGEV